jgi:hypothetical protein
MARETREVWAKRIERWIDSGLTAKEFAAELGVNPSTLASWKWRLGRGEAPPVGKAPETVPPSFVELIAATVPTKPAEAVEPLELVLETGHRLRIPGRFDPDSLRRVLAVLEAR